MKTRRLHNKCRKIRVWLYSTISKRIGLHADWVQRHIANCPRCQKRLALTARVEAALSIVKSKPHRLELLKQANRQAIGVLSHKLRNAPKAQKLKEAIPEPKLFERMSKYKSQVANLAACITILFLMKTGVFSSMQKFQSQGEETLKQYYASHLGSDLTDDIFMA